MKKILMARTIAGLFVLAPAERAIGQTECKPSANAPTKVACSVLTAAQSCKINAWQIRPKWMEPCFTLDFQRQTGLVPSLSPPSAASAENIRFVLENLSTLTKQITTCKDRMHQCQFNYRPPKTFGEDLGETISRGVSWVKTAELCKEFSKAPWFGPTTELAPFVASKLGFKFPAQCLANFKEGFICDIPDGLKDAAKLFVGAFQACARDVACRPTMMTPVGLVHGAAIYLGRQVDAAAKCLANIPQNKIWGVLLSVLTDAGCKILGSLALDAVLGVLSGGSGVALTVAKWLNRLKHVGDVALGNALVGKGLMKAGENAKKVIEENLKGMIEQCSGGR